MHPKVAQAIQEIDSAIFNGDTFEDPDDRAELLAHIARWTRELSAVERRGEISRAVHEGPPGDDDRWTNAPEYLSQYDVSQYDEHPSPAVDRRGITHAVRTWRSGPAEARNARYHADCGAEHGSDGLALTPAPPGRDVTCMACIAEGPAR